MPIPIQHQVCAGCEFGAKFCQQVDQENDTTLHLSKEALSFLLDSKRFEVHTNNQLQMAQDLGLLDESQIEPDEYFLQQWNRMTGFAYFLEKWNELFPDDSIDGQELTGYTDEAIKDNLRRSFACTAVAGFKKVTCFKDASDDGTCIAQVFPAFRP